MITVIEGISASGKSTWCARHGGGAVVPETGHLAPAPELVSSSAPADFWVGQNARRWGSALAIEMANGSAVCDTDPLKLHYAWSLWQVGAGAKERWERERAVTRQAISDHRLGFADAYFIGVVDPEVARRQREGDLTRQRRNFELHLRLQPSLLVWYRALGSVLPGRVTFGFPEAALVACRVDRSARYDLKLFDAALALLPDPEADGG